MNIYNIINEYNKSSNIFPWYYIGSDTRDRDSYMGSSKTLTADIVRIGLSFFTKQLLWTGDKNDLESLGYSSLVELERWYQQQHNVVRSIEYYNKCLACTDFTTYGKANFYYPDDPHKKIVVFPLNHPDVVNGVVVGQHRGKTRKGTYSPDRGKKISETLSKYYKHHTHHKKGVKSSEETKQRMRKPKEPDHKQKIGDVIRLRCGDPLYREKMALRNGRRTTVYKYTMDMQLVDKYDTIKSASESIGGGNKRCDISACCRGRQKSAYGFIWSYEDISG